MGVESQIFKSDSYGTYMYMICGRPGQKTNANPSHILHLISLVPSPSPQLLSLAVHSAASLNFH